MFTLIAILVCDMVAMFCIGALVGAHLQKREMYNLSKMLYDPELLGVEVDEKFKTSIRKTPLVSQTHLPQDSTV